MNIIRNLLKLIFTPKNGNTHIVDEDYEEDYEETITKDCNGEELHLGDLLYTISTNHKTKTQTIIIFYMYTTLEDEWLLVTKPEEPNHKIPMPNEQIIKIPHNNKLHDYPEEWLNELINYAKLTPQQFQEILKQHA